jgi:ATP-dependent helicase/nuclease subunit A
MTGSNSKPLSGTLTDSVSPAVNPKVSAWVSANAGSGKTYVLITRLVTLMLDGVAPEKLLCLTYTRSAAAEMQNRLYQLLGEWARLSDTELSQAILQRTGFTIVEALELYKARTLFARALETPGGLRVQTIHAFCESILHRFPLEANLTPNFSLMDDGETWQILTKICEQIITHPDDEEIAKAVDMLIRNLTGDDLQKLAKQLIGAEATGKSPDTVAVLQRRLSELFSASPSLPQILEADIEPRMLDFANEIKAFLPRIDEVVIAVEGARNKEARDRFFRLADLDRRSVSEIWLRVRDIFETASKGTRRKQLFTKAFIEHDHKLVEDLENLSDRFHIIEANRRLIQRRRLTRAVYTFSFPLIRKYKAEKVRRNLLDYDDLIRHTNYLLANSQAVAWVQFKIDSGLDHILVDEAQDTSPEQWKVIRALADEFFTGMSAREDTRTIFAVGDEKQSIFSFQGARPEKFDEMRRYFAERAATAESGFASESLRVSRRSAPEILQAVDAVFSTPATRDGLTAQKEEIRHAAYRQNDTGYVELWDMIETQKVTIEDSPADIPQTQASVSDQTTLADRIADKIVHLLKDPDHEIRQGDILILVRKRDDFFYAMLKALRNRKGDIRIAGADRMKLLDQLVVKDLLIAGEVALIPQNDLALAIFLRSPFCACDEDMLRALAYGRTGSLYQALVEAAEQTTCALALKQALSALHWLMDSASRLTPFDFFSQFLARQNEEGRSGLYQLTERLGYEIEDPVAEFLRLALEYERYEVPSIQGFINWVRATAAEIKRDMEQGVDAVRIMTVHGAKGLEAPIVFLPNSGASPVRVGRDRVDEEAGMLMWSSSGKELTEMERDARVHKEALDLAESQRLLYVALTRACDRLYIGGYLGPRKEVHEHSWYAQIAENFKPIALHHAASDYAYWSLGDEGKAGPWLKGETVEPVEMAPPPAWVFETVSASLMSSNRRPQDRLVHASNILGAQNISQYVPSAATARALSKPPQLAIQKGNILHRLLQYLPALSPEYRQASMAAYLDHYSEQYDVQTRAAMAEQVNGVLSSPALAPLFADGSRAEQPLVGNLIRSDGSVLRVSGQIDRYCELDDAIWIADYKTGIRDAQGGIPDVYLSQMAAYRALVQIISGREDIKCLLIWTQTGEIDWLASADLDRITQEILTVAP